VAGVGDLVWRNGHSQAQIGYSVVGRSRGRVTLCVICTVHEEMWSAGFLIEPQNHWDDFLRFGFKTGGDGFYRFGLKTGGASFLV
jgi:hypothetical protein